MKSDIDCGHKYTRDEIIGKGSYATVYVGKHIQTARRVALKQISLFCAQDGKEDEYLGVPVSAARELSILKQMRHKNIISLFDCFSCPEYITLVFEYIPEDLRKYMDKKGSNISSQDIRLISEQILSGVAYLHSRQVIHRDLKPGNILVSSSTDIRIADFGMAICPVDSHVATNVVTLHYRAPELLVGVNQYPYSIDTWSIGCILGELANDGTPIIMENDDELQWIHIIRLFGLPDEHRYPILNLQYKRHIPADVINIVEAPPSFPFQDLVKKLNVDGLDLMRKLLNIAPEARITAKNALLHRYFYPS